MNTHRGWRPQRPGNDAWKPTPGLPHTAYAAEQDTAAGSRDARRITLADGTTALASVALRQPGETAAILPYLRWSQRGKTQERFISEVTHTEPRGQPRRGVASGTDDSPSDCHQIARHRSRPVAVLSSGIWAVDQTAFAARHAGLRSGGMGTVMAPADWSCLLGRLDGQRASTNCRNTSSPPAASGSKLDRGPPSPDLRPRARRGRRRHPRGHPSLGHDRHVGVVGGQHG